jgi:hypothetical protein
MESRDLNLEFLRKVATNESVLEPRLEGAFGPIRLSRRAFLATSAVVACPLSASASVYLLADNLSLEFDKDRVILRLDGIERFSTERRNFAGTPILEVGRDTQGYVVSLKEARFPGLNAAADYRLVLRRGNRTWRYDLELPYWKAKAEGDLIEWLQSERPARALVQGASVLKSARLQLKVESGASLSFLPDWTLELHGPRACAALIGNDTIMADGLGLTIQAQSRLLEKRGPARASVLALERGPHRWRVELPVADQLQAGQIVAQPFDRVRIEAAEPGGRARHAVLFQGISGETAIILDATPLDHDFSDQQISLPFTNVTYAVYPETGESYMGASLADDVIVRMGAFEHTLRNPKRQRALEILQSQANAQPQGEVTADSTLSVYIPGAIVRTVRPPRSARFRLGLRGMLQTIRETLHIFPVKKVAYQMFDKLTLELIRPRDMLSLRIRFAGMRFEHSLLHTFLVPDLKGNRHASDADVAKARQSAKIIVEFPEQVVGEEPACETSAGVQQPPPHPIKSRLPGRSRLVFRPFADNSLQKLPLELDALLGWGNWPLAVSSAASLPIQDGKFVKDGRLPEGFTYRGNPKPPSQADLDAESLSADTKAKAPAEDETSLEVVYGLVISPNKEARFRVVEQQEFTPKARVVAWHTRLETEEPPAAGGGMASTAMMQREEKRRLPATRIIWAPNLIPAQDIANAAVPATRRKELVDSFTTYKDGTKLLAPPAMPTSLLVLSAQGGWFKGSVDWERLSSNDLIGVTLAIAQGHNENTVIVRDGYLLCSGHRAALIRQTRRRWVAIGSALYSFDVIVCYLDFGIDNTMNYPAEGQPNQARDLPCKQIKIRVKQSPYLDLGETSQSGSCDCGNIDVLTPRVGGKPYRVPISFVDHEKREVKTDMGCTWVSAKIGDAKGSAADAAAAMVRADFNSDADKALAAYAANSLVPLDRSSIDLNGTKIALAPSSKPGDTQFPVDRIIWKVVAPDLSTLADRNQARQPAWYPTAFRIALHPETVKSISAATIARATLVEYYPDYVKGGFPSQVPAGSRTANTGEVYLCSLDRPALEFPAKLSGSLSMPSLDITGYSRKLGAVGGDLAKIRDAKFEVAQFFKGPKLLGILPLVEIIADVLGFGDQLQKVPKLISTEIRDIVDDIAKLQKFVTNLKQAVGVLHGYIENAQTLAAQLEDRTISAVIDQVVMEIDGQIPIAQSAEEALAKAIEIRNNFQNMVDSEVKDIAHLREYVIAKVTESAAVTQAEVDRLRQVFVFNATAAASAMKAAIRGYAETLRIGLVGLKVVQQVAALGQAIQNKSPEQAIRSLHALADALQDIIGADSVVARAQRQADMLKAQWVNAAEAFKDRLNADVLRVENEVQTRYAVLSATVNHKLEKIRDDVNIEIQKNVTNVVESVSARFQQDIANRIAPIANFTQQMEDVHRELRELIESLHLPKEIRLHYDFNPDIHNDPTGIFLASNDAGKAATLSMSIEGTVRFDGSAPTWSSTATLTDFRLRLIPSFPFLQLSFERLQFTTTPGSGAQVDVRIKPVDGVQFLGPLDFVQDLQKWVGKLDNKDKNGPFLAVSGQGITAGLRFRLPNIKCGMFQLSGVAFEAGITLPFTGGPVTVHFAFASRSRPFLLAFGIFGGGGFFSLEMTPEKVTQVEAALEFGVVASINLFVAEGTVQIMGGFYYRLNENGVLLTGYFRAFGELNVLGLISASVQFWLTLTYEQRLEGGRPKAWLVGECSVTVEISFAFFSVSVSISMRREFSSDSGGQAYFRSPSLPAGAQLIASVDDIVVSASDDDLAPADRPDDEWRDPDPIPVEDWRPGYLRYMDTYAW